MGVIVLPYVAPLELLWHSDIVRRRLYQRWFLALGMLAMLGAVVAVPVSSTYALGMATSQHGAAAAHAGQHAKHAAMDQHTRHASGAKQDMPCHKPVKHCPNCPQNACPDLGNCLVKCFQQLSPPQAEAQLLGIIPRARVAPAPSRVSASSLIPPLLRPPSA